MSLVGALTPLGKVAPLKWFASALGYTFAGCIGSSIIGSFCGMIGSYIGRGPTSIYILALYALFLAAREKGWIRFKLPQIRRQTEKTWAHDYGFVTAAMMWGFQLGLGITTYLTHGGFLLLLAASLAFGQPAYGALLITAYWLGRTISVWLAPLFWRSDDLGELLDAILMNRQSYENSVSVGLTWSAILMLISIKAG